MQDVKCERIVDFMRTYSFSPAPSKKVIVESEAILEEGSFEDREKEAASRPSTAAIIIISHRLWRVLQQAAKQLREEATTARAKVVDFISLAFRAWSVAVWEHSVTTTSFLPVE